MLVLQDLGERMKPFESWMYPSTTSTTEPPPSLETCSSVGTRLGKILASVHCDATLALESQRLTAEGKLWFENPDTKDLIRDEIVGKILPILQPWIDPGTDRTERIVKIISQDFECSSLETLRSSPSLGVPQSMFSMGDLWTGSIIVCTSPAASSSNRDFGAITGVEVGLIDWEFVSPARIGQDIAQLSSWLYLFSTSSAWSSTGPRCRRTVSDATVILSILDASLGQIGPDSGIGASRGIGVEGGANPGTGETLGRGSTAGALMNALLRTYGCKVKEYPDYAWSVDEDYDRGRYKKERLAVIRSIWILFGREIIYNSVEAGTRFFGLLAVDADRGEREEEEKMWQREMIDVGCWYVSMGGESRDEEFEEAVRREGVLKMMYTVSGCL